MTHIQKGEHSGAATSHVLNNHARDSDGCGNNATNLESEKSTEMMTSDAVKKILLGGSDGKSSTDHSNQQDKRNVVIIQGHNSIDGSSLSLLKYVKSLLSGETSNSVMVISKDGVKKELKTEPIQSTSNSLESPSATHILPNSVVKNKVQSTAQYNIKRHATTSSTSESQSSSTVENTTKSKIIQENTNSTSQVQSANVEEKDIQSSDSIITMYLSSPGELKDKLEKLKTNSPVIVLQAGEDVSMAKKRLSNADDIPGKSEVGDGSENEQNLNKTTSSPEGLVAALSSLSSSPVIYRCVECDYSSHNKHYYKQHVDLVHNADRPYKCPHCDYAGKRRHALLEHMVVHSNQRPFSCEHCNASFRKKGHLTNHIKLHTSQRLVHCGVCNIQLPDAEAFEAHLQKIHKTDKLYKCQLCDHTVVDREAMLAHLQIHREPKVYSCHKCSHIFRDEEGLKAHMKYAHDFVILDYNQVPASSSVPEVKSQSGVGLKGLQQLKGMVKVFKEGDVKVAVNPQKNNPIEEAQTANIMCSECGFVCSKPSAMKKHMWVHINKDKGFEGDSSQLSQLKENSGADHESGASLGILKMNVNKGQKSLPNNVTYQCSSCCFSSSDNSVFIKHMLAHKTQQKQQNLTPVIKKVQNLETFANNSLLSKTDNTIQRSQQLTEVNYSPDANVPFVYDKSSGRYRCVICGYHCEFQRTIKAHIWKHSGHQNIQYPVFEPHNKTTTATVVVSSAPLTIVRSGGSADVPNYMEAVPQITSSSTTTPRSVHPVITSSIISSADKSHKTVTVPTEKIPEVLAYAEVETESVKNEDSSSKIEESGSDQNFKVGIQKVHVEEKCFQDFEVTKPMPVESRNISVHYDSSSSREPGVVVETVESVHELTTLTGMKSQQGSPRVSDLEGSGETNSLKGIQSYNQLKKVISNVNEVDLNNKTNVNEPKKSEETTKVTEKKIVVKNSETQLIKLRCPSCDCLLLNKDELRSHLLTCNGNVSSNVQNKQQPLKSNDRVYQTRQQRNKPVRFRETEEEETLPEDDASDATESSDEQTVPNDDADVGHQQKTGICSSLLAVIEQLRERSQLENDEGKSTKASKKSSKKGPSFEESNLSEDDVQNIEKIIEKDSIKFRCSLCHYTSQKISNIKLHMKTHRQKKPSECSLCDFLANSPEELQEHMLQHCKVRTYACKFCPQSFNHKSTLRAHLRAHKDHEPFLCAYCVFETTNPLEYREHMQVHSGCSSRLRCPLCDNIFGNKDELTNHLLQCKGSARKSISPNEDRKTQQSDKDVAEPENPDTTVNNASTPGYHSCVVYGCTFTSPNLKELQDHLSIHCNPSLLVCNLCDFKALHSRSLKSHMKRHANDQRYVQQPLEQYKCNLCGYVCHHLPSLKSHMWRHASDQSYSYEFTNDVINAAIDHDSRVDSDATEVDDPELLDRVINSERKILEGELAKSNRGNGQRPVCWVTFRCCSCGFETINKAKLNIHMRSHSDLIQQALDIPRMAPGKITIGHRGNLDFKQQKQIATQSLILKPGEKRALGNADTNNSSSCVYVKVRKVD